MKRLISVALLLVIAFTFAAYPATAQGSDEYNEYYEVSDVLAHYLQLRLAELGYYTGDWSDRYDGLTQGAVKAFQESNGFTVNGIVDLALIKSLFINPSSFVSAIPTSKPTSSPNPSPTPMPTLPSNVPVYSTIVSRGSSGKLVEYIQIQLWMLDYYRGDVTGTFDDATRDAVIAFQRNNHLDSDGVVGKQSWNKLFFDKTVYSAYETPPPTPSPFPTVEYGKFNYTEVARYPEKHIADLVKIDGTVAQVLGSRDDGYELRFRANNDYDQMVYVYILKDPGFGILDGDKLRIYGMCSKTVTYKTVLGASVTLPLVIADRVELRK